MTDLVPLQNNKIVDGRVITPEGTEFEITPERLALFQDSNGDWRDIDQWPQVQAISICHTEGCPVYNEPIELTLAENVDGVFRAMCGGCNAPPNLYEMPS